MTKLVATAALLAGAVSFTACEGFGQAMTSHTDVLARAAGHELTIDQAVNLLRPHDRVPAQAEVVDALANLWIDYTLLAKAALEDSTLSDVDLNPLLTPYFNQQLVFKLRDKVVKADTALTDEQLRQLFTQQQAGVEVKARHVLLRLPADATPVQRDSVLKLAVQVRDEARGGADFAKLAAQHSQEPNAAERGGDLGYFGKGQMDATFEQAAFALQPGQVSDVVETPHGLHVIKVEDKKLPNFEEGKEGFRQQVLQQRVQQAEEQYLKQLTESRKLEVQEGAIEVAKDLATRPTAVLSRRAGNRELVKYDGGEVTAREYLEIMRGRNAPQRTQIAAAADEDLREWLRLLARDEILVSEADKEGFKVDPAEQDSLRREARAQLLNAARAAGLMPVQKQADESESAAIDRVVMGFLEKILKQEASVLPLNAIAYSLREKHDGEVFERAIQEVVTKVQAARPPATPAPGIQTPGGTVPTPQGTQPQPPQGTQQTPPGGPGGSE
jgi:peptidyl-prolyl cis-trans isomerase C